MNFDFYLFGTPDGYDQYPWDDKEILFQSFYDKNCPIQLSLYRNAELVYFTYIRNINEKTGSHFGMSLVFNGAYPANLAEVVAVFESLFVNVVNKGRFLRKDRHGHVVFTGTRLAEAQDEIEELTRNCRTLVENRLSWSETRLPEEYVVQERIAAFAFDSNYLPTPLDDLLKYYNRIYLTKGKTGNSQNDSSSSGKKRKWVPFVIALLIVGLLVGAFLYLRPIINGNGSQPPEQSETPGSNGNQSPTLAGQVIGEQDDKPVEISDTSPTVKDEKIIIEQPKPKTDPPAEKPKPKVEQPKPKTDPPAVKPKPKEEQTKPPITEPKTKPKPKEEPAPKNNVRNVTNLGFSEGYYTGTLHGDIIEGNGTFVYTSGDFAGDKYEGGWKNNKFDGYGVYTCNPQNTDYIKLEGYWKNGKLNGKGVCYYKNGDRYDGEFVNGHPNGVGKYYFTNGERHEGQFKSGLPNGQGKLYYSNGKLKYEGEFKNGLFDGMGTYYFTSGNVYNGLFKNGEKVN